MDNFFLNPSHISLWSAHIIDQVNSIRMGGENPALNPGRYSKIEQQDAEDYLIIDNIAVINIKGSLSSEQLPSYYGATSYESIVRKIENAVENPAIEKIVLKIHSPGGTVTGCAEAAHRIDELSNLIPIWSYCTMADSAAYWIASATNKIIVDPTGEVGSIGVIMTHMDMSKMLDDIGISITHIFSGSHKSDGSPFQSLTDSAKTRFQENVDFLRQQFVDTVANYRGVEQGLIYKTEALTYAGVKAVESKLADEVGFFSQVVKSMSLLTVNHYISTQQHKETKPMGKKDYEEKQAEDNKAEDNKNASEDQQQVKESNNTEEKQENSSVVDKKAEKTRISEILNCEEAKGREELAKSLALNSDISAEEAKKHLAASSKNDKSITNPLSEAMDQIGNPNISNDAEQKQESNPLIASQKQYRPNTIKG